jgi:hypothetical protein
MVAYDRIYVFSGFLCINESEYKRMYICFNDDGFTEKFLTDKIEAAGLDYHPVQLTGYSNQPPGFFVKYNGKSKYKIKSTDQQECILADIIGKHVVIKVQYKTYNYKEKSGWNLTCIEMCTNE